MADCTPVDLGGGTTPQSPCTGILGFSYCAWGDYVRVRNVLRLERNGLVTRLNWWNSKINTEVNGKPVTWTPVATAAWDLDTLVEQTLEQNPETFWAAQFAHDAPETMAQTVFVLAKQAAAVHAANCDMDAAIAALGVEPPSAPVMPPEPEGITDLIRDGFKNIASAAAYGVAAVALVVVGLYLFSQRSSGGPAHG